MAKYSDKEWTDDRLLEMISRQDDRAAFAELYNRYWDKIFLLAANALGSAEEAEECVQDIFFNIWNRRATLQLKYSFYTYLAVAVKYRVINILDKAYRQRMRLSDFHLSDDTAPSAEVPLLEKELFDALEDAINRLPEKCRIVFKMSREEGKSHKQIADELNISEKTVGNHINKAIKDLGNDMSNTTGVLIMLVHLFK